jgi:hypothetical protein
MCDRRRYLRWVFEAKKRFGLSVLNLPREGLRGDFDVLRIIKMSGGLRVRA